jgi:hypothetical protein
MLARVDAERDILEDFLRAETFGYIDEIDHGTGGSTGFSKHWKSIA